MSSQSNSLSGPQDHEESPLAPKRGVARVVITAEEALSVPQSALKPEKQLQLTPSSEPGISVDAIISTVLGIIGTPLIGILVGWFAIAFGVLALREIDGPKRMRGRGLALAGIALGIFDVVLWLALFIIYGRALFTQSAA